jgi:sugar/nucleoside kinase (ribokinase family)
MRTLILGESLVDLICERPVASPLDADSFVPHFGGAGANVALTAARAGADVALAGGAGHDTWGRWLRGRLGDAGVALDHFALLEGVRTGVAFVTVDPGGEPDFVIYDQDLQAVTEHLGDGLLAAVEAADAFFFSTGTMVGEQERAVTSAAHARALDLGLPVVFDPNLRPGRWANAARATTVARDCVPGAFLVKANRSEARLLTGEDDPARAAEALLAAGAQTAVVTLGAEGALLRGPGMKRHVPGRPATPLNATGAGDTLAGTLLARLAAAGWYPPAIAAGLDAAVAAAAAATERWGAVA